MFSGCSSKYIENFMDVEEQQSVDQKEEIPLPADVSEEETTYLPAKSKKKAQAKAKKMQNDAADIDHGTDEDLEENDWQQSEDVAKGQETSTKARKDYLKVPKDMENVASFEDTTDGETDSIEEGFVGSAITGKYMLKILLLALLITLFIYIYSTKELSSIIKMISAKIKALPHDVIHYGIIFLVIYLTLLIFDWKKLFIFLSL